MTVTPIHRTRSTDTRQLRKLEQQIEQHEDMLRDPAYAGYTKELEKSRSELTAARDELIARIDLTARMVLAA